MPTFTSFAAWGREVEKMRDEIERSGKRKITHAQAEKAQKIANSEAAQDFGGDRRIGNWPPAMDTQVKTKPNGESVLMPTRSGAGAWTVAEFGRNQGNASGFSGPGIGRGGRTARNRDGSVRRVRARQSRRWNGRTQGKRTASRAVSRMDRELPRIADDGVRRVMRKHFDVT